MDDPELWQLLAACDRAIARLVLDAELGSLLLAELRCYRADVKAEIADAGFSARPS